jgi:transcriptional regulator with XRE-family HTH domain
MLTSEQIRAARAMLRIDQRELAVRSGVSLETIKRIERIPGPISAYTSTMAAIQRALEDAGIEFISGNGGGPGARLRKPVAALSVEPGRGSKPSGGAKTGTRRKAATARPAAKPAKRARKPS